MHRLRYKGPPPHDIILRKETAMPSSRDVSASIPFIILFAILFVLAGNSVLSSVPSPWMEAEIGSGGPAGSASLNDGVFSITGSGQVGGSSDRCYFVYQKYIGDFEFVARLATLSSPSGNSPGAGVMLRIDPDPNTSSIDADSRQVHAAQYAGDAGAKIIAHYRPWQGDPYIGGFQLLGFSVGNGTSTWQKMTRYKDVITIYGSMDGASWRWVDSVTLGNMPAEILVGMSVHSNNETPATATFADVSVRPLSRGHITSWAGNSGAGRQGSVPHNVNTLHVEADPNQGRIYTNVTWDEAAKEATIYLPDGTTYGSLRETHGWGRDGGYAVTSMGTGTGNRYVFMGMVQRHEPYGVSIFGAGSFPPQGSVWYAIRRYDRRGVPAPFGDPNTPNGGYDGSIKMVWERLLAEEERHIGGLAWDSWQSLYLYASVTRANEIRRYNVSLVEQSPFPFSASSNMTLPRALAVDPANGHVWVIGNEGTDRKVFHFQADGSFISPAITVSGWDPTGIAIDASGMVWVSDKGPAQQVRKFNQDGTSAGVFGETGGIYSGIKGAVGDLKFDHPMGVGVDALGNVYVAGDPGVATGSGGTDLRRFRNQAGALTLDWRRLGLEFIDCGDFDAGTNGRDVYTREARYSIDYSQDSGQGWAYMATTVDPFADPNQDARFQGVASGGVFVRRYPADPTKRFLFMTNDHGTHFSIYRFSEGGETAVPAGMIIPRGCCTPWPPGQPSGSRSVWIDADGDGVIEANEFTVDAPNQSQIWGWFVDDNMDIWTAGQATAPYIRRYPVGPLVNGSPSYSPMTVVDYDRPEPGIAKVTRTIYSPATDTMYLGIIRNTDPVDPNNDPDAGQFGHVGREIRKYQNWVNGSWPPARAWKVILPTDDTVRSVDVAGSRLYVLMYRTRRILVYDVNGTPDGLGVLGPLKVLEPGPEAGEIGWMDTPIALNAFQRSNGEYLVATEDGLASRVLIHQEAPARIYSNDMASNPFSVSSGTGGSTQIVTLDGNAAVEFRDTTGVNNKNTVSVFTAHLGVGAPLVSRINSVYSQSIGTPAVIFDLSFKLERTAASNRPLAAGITGGIEFNNYDNISVPQYPTGNPEPSVLGTLAYVHDETSPPDIVEGVDRAAIASYRFTVVPNGGARLLTGLDFRFRVQVDKTPNGQPATTPEAFAIDDLSVSEVTP
jgi:hypothetical protein